MSYSNKTTLKLKLKSLIFPESIFRFAQMKEECLKITMEECTKRYVKKVVEEAFQFVSKPVWERKKFKPMTTNQSESIHHVLKNYVSWEKTNIPEMINNVKSVLKFQYENLEFSICDQGKR